MHQTATVVASLDPNGKGAAATVRNNREAAIRFAPMRAFVVSAAGVAVFEDVFDLACGI